MLLLQTFATKYLQDTIEIPCLKLYAYNGLAIKVFFICYRYCGRCIFQKSSPCSGSFNFKYEKSKICQFLTCLGSFLHWNLHSKLWYLSWNWLENIYITIQIWFMDHDYSFYYYYNHSEVDLTWKILWKIKKFHRGPGCHLFPMDLFYS